MVISRLAGNLFRFFRVFRVFRVSLLRLQALNRMPSLLSNWRS